MLARLFLSRHLNAWASLSLDIREELNMQESKADCRSVRIIRLQEVVAKTGLGRSTIYAKLSPKSGCHDLLFPRQIQLGGRSVGWLEHEVDAWIASRARSHGGGHANS